MEDLGIVVIGCNEGDCFKDCLRLVVEVGLVIYVDFGFIDNSIEFVEFFDVVVVCFDLV